MIQSAMVVLLLLIASPGVLKAQARPVPDAIVVFIHGLYGSADTWRRDARSPSWPSMLESDADLTRFATYVANYPTGCTKQSSIHETAIRLLQQLKADGVLAHRRIAIVAHSMGGLVAKDLLLALTADDRAKVGAVFLLGTPSQGADVAAAVNLFCPAGSAKDLANIEGNGYLQRLEDDWQRGAREARAGRARFPEVFCAYETRPVVRTLLVVPRSHAATTCDDDPLPVDDDHLGIVKPPSRDALVYKWVKSVLVDAHFSVAPCLRQEFPGGVGSSGWILLARYDLRSGRYVSEPRFEILRKHSPNELPSTDDTIRLSVPVRVIIRGFANTPPRDLEKAIQIPPHKWGAVEYANDFSGMWLCEGAKVEIRQRDLPNESDPIANVWARVAYVRE